jgi:hypothetical protein
MHDLFPAFFDHKTGTFAGLRHVLHLKHFNLRAGQSSLSVDQNAKREQP